MIFWQTINEETNFNIFIRVYFINILSVTIISEQEFKFVKFSKLD